MKHQTYIARQVWGWHQLDCEVFREGRLWVTFNYLLGSGRTGRESDIHFFTAGDFLESFISKMLSICEATAIFSFPFVHPESSFQQIILASVLKTCKLDPLATSFLQEMWTFFPLLTVLYNLSLQEGILPPSQKNLSPN